MARNEGPSRIALVVRPSGRPLAAAHPARRDRPPRARAAGRPLEGPSLGRRPAWTLGCNYIPRTAVNTLEMWQAETFDPLDHRPGARLGRGPRLQRRPRLPPLSPLATRTPAASCKRLERFLEIADRHHIGTMFVLFDDCWNAKFALGPQPAPRPGVHNSGWVQCPGPDLLEAPARWGVLEAYTKGVVGFFRDDRRVLAWDLYNEPGNSGLRFALPAAPARSVFAWAWAAAAESAPDRRASGTSRRSWPSSTFPAAEHSDVISFHSYQTKAGRRERGSPRLEAHGRPLVCTEYMARTAGSRFEDILPLFQAKEIGAMNWGFVKGKTQTVFPWGSKEGRAEPAVWFHDVMRPDGAPTLGAEAALIRGLAGKHNAPRAPATPCRRRASPSTPGPSRPPLG
ncbi:MAG: 1,4-beta-xylanase [Sphingobacterium sp.]|nr:1,4-beta-xylanase [Sphingobacterium sp.]